MGSKREIMPQHNIHTLITELRELITLARNAAARSVNTIQIVTNFEIGRRIVEHEQQGEKRAEYGKTLLKRLSAELIREFGRGFSEDNLSNMRKFYLTYKERSEISGTLSRKLLSSAKSQASSGQLQKSETLSQKFTLSWSHYVFLLGVKNPEERSFYEIEATGQNWSIRELKRQFNTGLYERLSLSRDKGKVKELSEKGQIIEKPGDMIKYPYVLEFLGLDEKAAYSENDLETAIIDKLEHFLLELGKGFLFEARQKRFTFDADHFFVDLVFYNRLLRCYVLIDLKIGKLTHLDLGQMQMYINYFDRHVRLKDENPSVGIVLCKMKNNALVKLTLPENANIYASQYQLYLPSKEELRQKLMEWAEGNEKGMKDGD